MDSFEINEDQKLLGEAFWNIGYRHKVKKAKKGYKAGDIYTDPTTWQQLWDCMIHDKSCWLWKPYDLFLHAIFLYGMDRGVVIQSKKTNKVKRFLLPAQI